MPVLGDLAEPAEVDAELGREGMFTANSGLFISLVR
jgi:hypothetical protein